MTIINKQNNKTIKIINKELNNTVNADKVNDFAYGYIRTMLSNINHNYHLAGMFDVCKGKTYLQLTTYNTKKSTDLLFIYSPDFYKSIVTLQMIDHFTDSSTYIEIPFNEIESVIKEELLTKLVAEWIRPVLSNAEKVVYDYKKEHNIK